MLASPCGAERLGIALEPEADYELRSDGSGGGEDPHITFVEPLRRYVMTYTALSHAGPRIAFAVSEDLFHWKRLGLATFEPFRGIDFVHVDNKDACFFPVAIPNHIGKMQMTIIHCPLFAGPLPEEIACEEEPCILDLDHESIWIYYCPMPFEFGETNRLGVINSHFRLATSVSDWEKFKIGCGNLPVLTWHGWLILYHGVSKSEETDENGQLLCYSAG